MAAYEYIANEVQSMYERGEITDIEKCQYLDELATELLIEFGRQEVSK